MFYGRFWKDESGSTLVVASLGMLVLLLFAGLTIDMGNLRSTKRSLQAAADAAALAAALEISSCHGAWNCSAVLTAAQSSMTENGYTGTTMLSNCAAAGNGLTLVVNNPPCARGASDPNSGNGNYVEVVASIAQKTYLASLLGYSTVPISVRAEAYKTPNPYCIYALDPSGGNALTVDLLATVTSACGVWDESSAWNALSCNLIASLTAPQVNVVGGAQGLLCLPSTTPTTGLTAPTPADPLAYLPKPSVPACGTSVSSPFHGSSVPLTIVGTATLYPDAAYCGGITITAASNVTFMPGTYVIKSGGLLGLQGGLTIGPLANVSGTGVTFYNYGPYGGINFTATSVNLGTVSLIAPTSGTYGGVLFFQDPQNTTGATMLVSSSWNVILEGAYYFPAASVTYAASLKVRYNILVAKDIAFELLTFASSSSTSTFSNDYSTLLNGSPLQGGGSVLVQ